MEGARFTRVNRAVFADCLFLIGQAWVKRAAGDLRGAAEDLTQAVAMVPPGTVEMITGMIEAGEWPEPGPDLEAMDDWLERCRQAGAGELRMTIGEIPARPARPVLPAPPPRRVEAEAEFLKRLAQVVADAEARHGTGPHAGRPRESRP